MTSLYLRSIARLILLEDDEFVLEINRSNRFLYVV